MQRYSEAAGTEGSVIEATDGDYILYADHVEAMKRIAGDSAQQEPVAWYDSHKFYGSQMAAALDRSGPVRPVYYAAPSASAQQASLEGRAWLFGVAVGMAKELGYDTLTDAFDALRTFKSAAPAPASPAALTDVDAVMTKIQEFASTWAVVGGRFDDGTAMECAEECKAEIRALLMSATPPAAEGE